MAKRPLGRNIVADLRGKVDPAVMDVLVGLAEYQQEQRQQILALAALVNKAVDTVNHMVKVTGVLKGQLDQYKEHLPKGIETEEVQQ